MTDITIIIPLHKFDNTIKGLLEMRSKALGKTKKTIHLVNLYQW